MTPDEVRAIAEELNFEIDYTPEGEMVLFTGVIEEAKRSVTPVEVETEFDDDDEEGVFDPYTT